MNFYKHHIGDYAQATSHLSFVEDAAYSRLIRKYYAEEKPLPADIKAVQRLVGARTREEKQAVADILDEFFELQEDGWHNKRCDAEIERANAQAETNRQIAIQREARRKERMAWNESGTNRGQPVHESLHESCASREPSQTPDSRRQTPDLKPLASANGISTSSTSAGTVCARLKADGIQGVNPQHPKLLKLLNDGLTVDEIASVGPEAKAKGKGFAWILAAAEGRRRDAATAASLPALPSEEWFMTASGIEAKAAEHGITKQRDETFPAFKARVYEAAGITDEMVRRAKIDRGERV